jgi:ABC-type nitrate/sulfonate/bicarbonate transport system ATPase subunit
VSSLSSALRRTVLVAAVLLGLVGLWELYRWIWTTAGWTWPFAVGSTSMPHVWTILKAFSQPAQVNQPALITILFHKSLFTGKEALVGFALGAVVGFAIGVVLAHSRLLQRGVLPYIVASQTVPILAIAPMVVVWVNPKLPTPLQGWGAVAVIAAYLTFFPVAINTLRGLRSADARAIELMRTYAANRWTVLWKLRVPASLPYVFAAFKLAATASVVGAIIGELPSGLQSGLGGAIINFNQYYSVEPQELWATNIVAAMVGILFFAMVVVAEKILVRRPPGEFVSLIAPSGCGKSTLLRVIGDLIEPTSGTVTVNGKTARRARADRHYGIVFQDAVLFDWRTVSKNIGLPLELLGWDRDRRKARVDEMLDLVELVAFENHRPWELSGGMQQRVSIARALSFEPALLLMDEPFGALDEMTRERLNLEVLSIWEKLGSTIVFVTHSISEAVFLSNRVVVMSPRPGRVAGVIEIDLPYPRGVETREDPRFFELVTAVRELLRRRGEHLLPEEEPAL